MTLLSDERIKEFESRVGKITVIFDDRSNPPFRLYGPDGIEVDPRDVVHKEHAGVRYGGAAFDLSCYLPKGGGGPCCEDHCGWGRQIFTDQDPCNRETEHVIKKASAPQAPGVFLCDVHATMLQCMGIIHEVEEP